MVLVSVLQAGAISLDYTSRPMTARRRPGQIMMRRYT
jgi:hypothetical protein